MRVLVDGGQLAAEKESKRFTNHAQLLLTHIFFSFSVCGQVHLLTTLRTRCARVKWLIHSAHSLAGPLLESHNYSQLCGGMFFCFAFCCCVTCATDTQLREESVLSMSVCVCLFLCCVQCTFLHMVKCK